MSRFFSLFLPLLFSIFVCLGSPTYAQVTNLSLTQLTTKNGLSQNTIYSIAQDQSGLIWIGTETGIDVYDGYNFKPVLGPDGDFSSYAGYIPLVDSTGAMWFSMEGKGVYRYNAIENEFTHVANSKNNDAFNHVYAIVEKDPNTFYFTTINAVYIYHLQSNRWDKVVDLSEAINDSQYITAMAFSDDVLLVGFQSGIVAYDLNTTTWRFLPKVTNAGAATNISFNERDAAQAYQLYIDESNTLYRGSFDGVFSIDIAQIKQYINAKGTLPFYKLVAPNLAVWQFHAVEEKLYVASHQGLTVIDTTTKKSEFLFSYSDTSDKVTDNQIYSLTYGNNGIWWLGSGSKGIFQWDPSRSIFTNFFFDKKNPKSLSNSEINSYLVDENNPNHYWVGTYNGLNYVDESTRTIESYLKLNDSKAIYSEAFIGQILQLNATQLLLSTGVDIKLFDTIEKRIVDSPFSDAINRLLQSEAISLYLHAPDDLWLHNDQGVFQLSLNTGEVTPVAELNKNDFHQSMIGILGFLAEKELLLISTTNGLWGFNPKTKQHVQLLDKPSPIAAWGYVDSYVTDKNDDLWLAYPGKGLLCLDSDTFEIKHSFDKSNSRINSNVYGVQTDADGDIWFSTHQGLYVLDIDSHHIRNITEDDGLPSQEFNSGAFAKLANGRLLYGSMAGSTSFDPMLVKTADNYDNLSVSITDVNILSRETEFPMTIRSGETIDLRYDDVGIRINFSTMSHTNKKMLYKYKLFGSQEAESPLTVNNFVNFPSLSSGTHKLEVRAQNPSTGEMTEPTVLTFKVSYAPWQSPFAFLAYFIVIFSALAHWQFSRYRQRERLLAMHEQVKYRENRLQLALTGSNSEVWDWHVESNSLFGKRAAQELGYQQYANAYPFEEHLALIHPNDKAKFLHCWQSFIGSSDQHTSFNCTYRLKSASGDWFWYKDVGKVVNYNEDNKPQRVTGSYTNITEAKASEERAAYFGDAFKKTQDWVLIINKELTHVIANKALQRVFGWENEEQAFSPELMGMSSLYQEKYRDILLSLGVDEHWRGEEVIKFANADEYHVIINISTSQHSTTSEVFYVCVFTDITAQKIAEQDLRYLANYDHLTNLPNRSLLIERIDHAMEHSQRNQKSIALFFIDLDRFKHVNDSLGHDYGDMLLKEITYRLTHTLRVDDTVARIGGDEFVVLLESYKGAGQLARIAQKIISAVEKPAELNDSIVSVGASIGIALYPDDANDADDLLRNADVAMYHAKQLGKNTFQFFTQRMNHEAESRLKIETNLQIAHNNNEFINHYQPIVLAETGEVMGFELLMRWQTEEGLIPPSTFINIAEEIGLLGVLTESALERGLADLKNWQALSQDIYLTVNISTQHFNKPTLAPYLASLLDKYQLSPRSLKLEITESALISEPERTIATMNRLRALGVQLALDDFGTGYSSLSYLKDLPLNIIKIDRSFISGIGIDSADESIIDITLALAERLNLHCVAEGVETSEQLAYLTERSCYAIQGFLFSKPVANQHVISLLDRSTIITA